MSVSYDLTVVGSESDSLKGEKSQSKVLAFPLIDALASYNVTSNPDWISVHAAPHPATPVNLKFEKISKLEEKILKFENEFRI